MTSTDIKTLQVGSEHTDDAPKSIPRGKSEGSKFPSRLLDEFYASHLNALKIGAS